MNPSTGKAAHGGSKKIVLGFSGGLDTSYCVKYLSEEKGFEVHSIIVNTGGFTEQELQQIEQHAYKLGPGRARSESLDEPCPRGR